MIHSPRSKASGVARYAAMVLPIAAAAAGLGYAYALFDYRCIPGDEGIVVQLAWKISEGQIPHRNYFFSVPPVSFMLLGAWFKIMGVNVFAERIFVLGQAIALVVLCDALLRRYTSNLLARSVVWIFLIPVGVYAWPVPSYHWIVAIIELGAALALLMAVIQLAVVGILILSLVNRWQTTTRIGVLGVLAVGFFGSCLHRYSLTNLVWAAPALILIAAWGISRLAQQQSLGRRATGWAGAILVIATAVAFGIGNLQMASAAATVKIVGRAGTLRSFGFSEETRVQHYVAAVEQHVPLDAPLFCTGYVGVVNFLTLRPNPTRHTQLVEFNTEEHAREVVEALRAHPRSYVLLTLPFDMNGALGQFLLYNFRPAWKDASAILLMPEHRGGQL